jgi:hypothetical protein
MTPDEERRYDEQLAMFERLRLRIDTLLEGYGKPDSLSALGDYSAHDDFRQSPQVKVSISNPKLLQPFIIYQLQEIVREFPGWEIVVAVVLDDRRDDWPRMGLYIRPREIIDGLQRQYFPKEYQDIEYAGARRGTEKD